MTFFLNSIKIPDVKFDVITFSYLSCEQWEQKFEIRLIKTVFVHLRIQVFTK